MDTGICTYEFRHFENKPRNAVYLWYLDTYDMISVVYN